MLTPSLATKLYRPLTRANSVRQPQLIARLNDRLERNPTLITAPAGFGKTTLLSQWLDDTGRPVAWLTFDDGDNEPARFLAYLLAALQTGVTEALRATQDRMSSSIQLRQYWQLLMDNESMCRM